MVEKAGLSRSKHLIPKNPPQPEPHGLGAVIDQMKSRGAPKPLPKTPSPPAPDPRMAARNARMRRDAPSGHPHGQPSAADPGSAGKDQARSASPAQTARVDPGWLVRDRARLPAGEHEEGRAGGRKRLPVEASCGTQDLLPAPLQTGTWSPHGRPATTPSGVEYGNGSDLYGRWPAIELPGSNAVSRASIDPELPNPEQNEPYARLEPGPDQDWGEG